MKSITIKEQDQNKRLDIFLTEQLLDKTRSQIKKMILQGLVLINGKQAKVHNFLKTNDLVEILSTAPIANIKTKSEINKTNNSSETKIFSQIKIIDDTEEYLVIEKPSGLLVHPTNKGETNTLVDWLLEKYSECRKIGEDPIRTAIVHRLDKEVSGLMVIPKTQDAYENLKKQFKLRTINKKYLALVYGQIKKDQGEIKFPIKRSTSKLGLFVALPIGATEGKKALTVYWVKERYKNYTLLEVEIITGRTHQIRVHLLALGHGIVGDQLYKNRKLKEKDTPGRIFLHAYQLAFTDLSGKRQEYQSDLPKVLKDFLKKIK